MVCIPRNENVQQVFQGITRGDYWAILGPRRMGKTTFLRQVQRAFSNAHYIYFNFEVPPANETDFYQRLMSQFSTEIPSAKKRFSIRKWKHSPELGFFDFLKKFKPNDDIDRIILLFDEIDGLPFLKNFLHLWRMVYHESYHRDELKKYVVVIASSIDLIALTVGQTSPFNIAERLNIKDFSETESRHLIEYPLKHLDIQIQEKAKQKLLSRVSGHPQLLQHACSLLVETAADNPGKPLTEQDVDHAVKILLATNSSLDTLKQDISRYPLLKQLIRDILDGKKKKFYPYKEFSLNGAGAIVDQDSYCAIRNSVYEEFFKGLFTANR
jgi:ABC-type cobalamin/Fe3+-siderophores transport system ATPase subunit